MLTFSVTYACYIKVCNYYKLFISKHKNTYPLATVVKQILMYINYYYINLNCKQLILTKQRMYAPLMMFFYYLLLWHKPLGENYKKISQCFSNKARIWTKGFIFYYKPLNCNQISLKVMFSMQ